MKKINILMLCVVCMTAVAKNNTITLVVLESTANVAVLADDNDPKKKSSKNKDEKKKKGENKEEKANLKAELDKKDAELEKTKAELEKTKAKLEKQEEQNKKEDAKRDKEKQEQLAKEQKIIDEYNKAKTDIARLRQEKQREIDNIKKRIYAQNDTIKCLEQRLNELKQNTAKATEKLNEVQNEKEALADYRKKTTEFLANGADFWLQKPYSTISITALDSVLNEYESIPELTKEKSVNDEKAKIVALRKNITLYNEAKHKLTNKYDVASVKELLPELGNMKVGNAETQQEVSELIKQLEYYPKQIEMFKKLIADIEGKIMENSRAASEVRINMFLKEAEQQKTIAEINKNPWLKKQYELYFKLLTKDYKKDNQYAALIKSIKTQ